LKDFLQDAQYGSVPSADVAQTLKHWPVTNLVGENALGTWTLTSIKNARCGEQIKQENGCLEKGNWRE